MNRRVWIPTLVVSVMALGPPATGGPPETQGAGRRFIAFAVNLGGHPQDRWSWS